MGSEFTHSKVHNNFWVKAHPRHVCEGPIYFLKREKKTPANCSDGKVSTLQFQSKNREFELLRELKSESSSRMIKLLITLIK